MTRPAVGALTGQVYDLLPGVYHEEDAKQAAGVNGYPLLRYLSTIVDPAAEWATILDRIDFNRDRDPAPAQVLLLSTSDAGTGSGAYTSGFPAPAAGLDVRVRWEFPTWPPPGTLTLAGVYDSASGNNRAWLLSVMATTGFLRGIVSADGTAVPEDQSSVAPAMPATGPKVVDMRWVWVDATNVSTFYTRRAARRLDLREDDGWEALGVAGTIAAAGIFASPAPLQVGSFNAGTGENGDGFAHDVVVKDGNGTLVAHLAPWDTTRWRAEETTTAEGPDGRTWNLRSESRITTRDQAADTSDLADAANADDDWLNWLALHVGVDGTIISTPAEKRERVNDAATGWLAGTTPALRAAVQTVLTGTKLVVINRHFGANPWAIEIQTDNSETPGGGASVLAAAAPAKAAGILLTHSLISNLTWTTWETLSTWTAIEAEGTWDQLQDA